jgi:hypothetical protein
MGNVRVRLVLAAVATLALVAAGCGGGGDDEGSTQAPAATAPAGDAVNLAEVCPNPVVIQTDWDPESEYGVYYHLLGPNPKVDTKKKLVSGPLVAGGKDTGVRLEVRTGGPSIGFEPVSSQMYKDPAITLGQVSTDEAIRFSAKQATLAVVAPMEISPFMIMWDPQAYPQFKTIADIGKTDTKVLYFEGDTYMAYLTGTGVLKKSQVDGSYDGKPGNFVAADYPFYPQALSIRAADKDKLAPCLKKLVPIIQRAQVDYLANPTETNKFVVDLVKQYNDGWVYSEGLANYAIEKMRSDFVKNGSDKTLGNFDNARLQRMIEIVTPIFTAQNQPPKSGLKPEDIATNEFIDSSIGIPA